MSYIDEFGLYVFLNGGSLLLLDFLLHFYYFLLVFYSSEGLENATHIIGHVLTHSYAFIVHFSTQNIHIDTFFFNHLPIFITEQHHHILLLVLKFFSETGSDLCSTVYETRKGLDERSCIEPFWRFQTLFISFVLSFLAERLFCMFFWSTQLSCDVVLDNFLGPIFPMSLFLHVIFG